MLLWATIRLMLISHEPGYALVHRDVASAIEALAGLRPLGCEIGVQELAGGAPVAPAERAPELRDGLAAFLYSHSIVAGGFEVTSSATRFTPGISFTIRPEITSSRSYGSRAQSAVIASSEVTARITIG